MPQAPTILAATRGGRHRAPARSARAARAHAAGEVRWTIDLGQPATATVDRHVAASRNYTLAGLSLLTAALWLYNVADLVTHVH